MKCRQIVSKMFYGGHRMTVSWIITGNGKPDAVCAVTVWEGQRSQMTLNVEFVFGSSGSEIGLQHGF